MVHNHKSGLPIVGAHQVIAQVQVLHWQACLMQHTISISREQLPMNTSKQSCWKVVAPGGMPSDTTSSSRQQVLMDAGKGVKSLWKLGTVRNDAKQSIAFSIVHRKDQACLSTTIDLDLP